MSFAAIITNTVRVAQLAPILDAAGADTGRHFREADNRRPIETQREGGLDRRFQVSARPVTDVFPRHGISDNVRNADVSVRMGYFRGGGDAGGGDRQSTNIRAVIDMLVLCGRVDNPANYDSVNTGIQRTTLRDFQRALDLDRTEFWDLNLAVEWNEFEHPQAVP